MHWIGSVILMFLLPFFHPFYISMTDINYNEADKELEISVRLFTDDFESVLRKQHPHANIDLAHPANKAAADNMVNEYIQKHLNIQVNGSNEKMKFIGYEQQQASTWAYFEVNDIASVQKINVSNTLLYDLTNNQSNIVTVKVNAREHTTRLNYPQQENSFSF